MANRISLPYPSENVPSRSRACMMTAKRPANAMRAFLNPRRFASFYAQALRSKVPRTLGPDRVSRFVEQLAHRASLCLGMRSGRWHTPVVRPIVRRLKGKIERWHQTLKSRILLENHPCPATRGPNRAFVQHYNHQRYQESLVKLTRLSTSEVATSSSSDENGLSDRQSGILQHAATAS